MQASNAKIEEKFQSALIQVTSSTSNTNNGRQAQSQALQHVLTMTVMMTSGVELKLPISAFALPPDTNYQKIGGNSITSGKLAQVRVYDFVFIHQRPWDV